MPDKGIEISVRANRGGAGCAMVFCFAFTILYGYTMLDLAEDIVRPAVTGNLNSYLRVGAFVLAGLIYPLPLAFFITLCIVGVVRIRNKNAILTVDQKGIYHRELVNKPIPWSEIRSICEERYS